MEKKGMASFFPTNSFYVFPHEYNFGIAFDSLLSKSGPGGRTYYSRRAPRMNIGGKEYKIGFSRHAIERMCERAAYTADYFSASGIYNYFSKFDGSGLCQLKGDGRNPEPAFAVFDDCAPNIRTWKYVEKILGPREKEHGKYKYRVGYFPLALGDNFAKAITMLKPGMRGTPEYDLLRKFDIDPVLMGELEKGIQNSSTSDGLFETGDFTALKWFHGQGVPQVVEVAGAGC
jgi:hypothetical protein